LNTRFTLTQSKFEGWARDIQLAYRNKTWVLGDKYSKNLCIAEPCHDGGVFA